MNFNGVLYIVKSVAQMNIVTICFLVRSENFSFPRICSEFSVLLIIHVSKLVHSKINQKRPSIFKQPLGIEIPIKLLHYALNIQ